MKTLEYLDFHVAGEPFRLITSGFPEIIGSTMEEKRRYAAEHLDDLRRLTILEPRGHDDMYGGFLTPPVNEESDLGVVFIHGTGMSTMCGHGAIAMGRAACELGILTLKEGMNTVTLDAPSGSVQLAVRAEDGKICDIALKNDLSFAYALLWNRQGRCGLWRRFHGLCGHRTVWYRIGKEKHPGHAGYRHGMRTLRHRSA